MTEARRLGRSELPQPQKPFPRRDNEMRSLRNQGLSWQRIAKAMDLSLGVIISRSARIGLRIETGRVSRNQTAKLPTLPPLKSLTEDC